MGEQFEALGAATRRRDVLERKKFLVVMVWNIVQMFCCCLCLEKLHSFLKDYFQFACLKESGGVSWHGATTTSICKRHNRCLCLVEKSRYLFSR